MRHPARLALGLGLALIVAIGILWASQPRGIDHADGAGILASANGPGFESMAIDPSAGTATSWTFGLRLCLTTGTEPAVIDTIEPVATVGAGFRYLGAGIREFTLASDHEGIISTHPYPPAKAVVPDAVSPAIGYAVTTRCIEGRPQGTRYTELLVGLGASGPDGGGWRGIRIGYHVGTSRRVLDITHDLLICGASLPDKCRRDQAPSPS